MENGIGINTLVKEFKRFFKLEKQSFENWDSIDIFVAETLSEAWLMARPYDKDKFLDKNFKEMVDSANGKWLEKSDYTDS